MSSEELKDHLVDLLYDDELDDETRASMRREVEGSDDAREDLEQFESMLGMIRDSTEAEEPSAEVHESIMAAARDHAENAAREKAAATERAPRVPSGDDEQSIWGRLSRHQATQLALAACAVLGAGFLFYLFSMQSADETHPAGTASSDDGKFAESSVSSSDEAKFNLEDEELAQAESEPAPTDQPRPRQVDPEVDELAKEEAKLAEEPSPIADRAGKKDAPSRPEADKSSSSGVIAERSTRSRSTPKPAPSKKRKSEADLSDDKFDPFDSQTSDSEERSLFGSRDSPRAEAQRRGDSTGSQSSPGESSDISGLAGRMQPDDDSQANQQRAQAPRGDDDGYAAGADSLQAPTEEGEATSDSDETSGTAISDVEQAYRDGNNQRVVTRADDIIDSGSAADTSMSRALELKGFALRNLERYDEADRTLARLQSEYPNYKTSTIQAARVDIAQQQREQREAKRRKRKPAREDSMDAAPETESMEPADESIDVLESY